MVSEQAAGAQPNFPPKMESVNVRQLSLELEKNPIATFYKDEGGKSNFLTASCLISVKSGTSSSFPIGNLRLHPRLVYESGGEIEDEEEIFNVLSVEPKTITSTNESFTVHFRIEKVSRRKDGKRFRIRFDINRPRTQLLDYVSIDEIQPVESLPVTVLSKRKSHAHLAGHSNIIAPNSGSHHSVNEDRKLKTRFEGMKLDRERSNRKRRISNSEATKQKILKQDDNGHVSLPLEFLHKLRDNMARLESSVKELSERVAHLENQNQMLRKSSPIRSGTSPPQSALNVNNVFSRGQRVHSLMFDEAFAGKFDEFGQSAAAMGSQVRSQRNNVSQCSSQAEGTIKRNASSTTELFEFLTTSSILN